MKLSQVCQAGLLAIGAAAVCGGATPEFMGVIVSQGTTHVAVRADAAEKAKWLGLGDTVGEYRIVSYDAKAESLTLTRAGAEITVRLKYASVQPTPTLTLLETLVSQGDIGLKEELEQLRLLDARRNQTAAELADAESRAARDQGAGQPVLELRRKLRIEERNLELYLKILIEVARDKARKMPSP